MPFIHSFERTPSEFVLLRAIGQISLVMWANAMRQVIIDPAFRDPMPVILDVTEALGPPEDTAIMAQTWCLMTPYSCGAVVAPDDVKLTAARQIEELSDERVRAFSDVPAAVRWLDDHVRR
jgi:hypothetical protein